MNGLEERRHGQTQVRCSDEDIVIGLERNTEEVPEHPTRLRVDRLLTPNGPRVVFKAMQTGANTKPRHPPSGASAMAVHRNSNLRSCPEGSMDEQILRCSRPTVITPKQLHRVPERPRHRLFGSSGGPRDPHRDEVVGALVLHRQAKGSLTSGDDRSSQAKRSELLRNP